ncbi:MAG: phage terminase small subunit P27 family [Magnetococcus sp. DMHC-1]
MPTNLKILHGNPGKRPLPSGEPRPETAAPPCPKWLLPDAKKEWRRVVTELKIFGLISRIDMALLAGYCQSWARWREAEEILALEGSTTPIASGKGMKRHPMAAQANEALRIMERLATHFGLSPSARTGLKVDHLPVQDDPMDTFLARRNKI